jgi:hypothetical protein
MNKRSTNEGMHTPKQACLFERVTADKAVRKKARRKAEKRRHYLKHRKRIGERNKAYKMAHREYYRTFQKEYRLLRLVSDPDWERRAALKKRYGMTLDDYNALLRAQNGTCAICFGPPRGRKRFHVDHDHVTNAVRGLLCWRCNAALGNLDENITVLARMIAYLTAHTPSERLATSNGSPEPQLGGSAG